MREIKFRAKMYATSEFLYGQYVDLSYYTEPDRDGDERHRSFHIIIDNNCEQFSINESTLGQFTGLHDKNGKEIYEGDIVTYGNGLWVCCWHTDSWRFSNLNGNLREQDQWLTYALDDLEVIGNIHENKGEAE